jgi:hypothetical protein
MLSRPHYLRDRIAALLNEFPGGGPELYEAIFDLFDEAVSEAFADFHRELPEMTG